MENVSKEGSQYRPKTISEEVRELRKEVDVMRKGKETISEKKPYKFPFKWQWKFKQSTKSSTPSDKALVLFFNKKNEIEAPMFLPIYSGNMIVYKNKPYEFDPRAIWRMKTKGYPMVYCIKEIDRRPVRNHIGEVVYKDAAISNNDIDEVRARGDSTESDEFLIKAALKAQTKTLEGKTNWLIGGVILLIIVIAAIWFFTKGGG